ncbi:MBL fold metallo-hydrolase [Cohnella lupini]|uniref:Glyoxylase-like metal-dependent hydrolase (Beta-lactamase superfamily II) n=1 Tax=Cohnella lupini TaxID=1294267 RepID=A0A3D9IUZ2_9BACL|nr:MBL fold metallo-hydrolase [Cohnella lupini]RED65598.1 glyoxylase-like metal-dependent hydrolase (beta-lactamase superfamily II) [Cohnella lupini]
MKKTTWGPVTQLIFLPRLFPLNCYLVEEDGGVTLIDACMPFVAKGIHAAIQATGKPLTRILLTHAHDDHIGAVPYLKEKYPEVKIGISRRDDAVLKGDRSLLPNEAQVPIKGGVPKKAPFEPDFLFDDNDRFGSLVAVATPGHTPGHFAFHETISNTVIAGDAFQAKGGFAVSGTLKWKFPFPALATWHAPTAIASAHRVLKLNPTLLVVGHGPALLQPAAEIKRALVEAEQRQNSRRNTG